ncbi:MAG: sigma-70 family RNA polymerase sigma factor [Elusimicrobia bacterium]|nr:sigma-70 family RNA polymerase sigma factor [Elusimicrobiota bacterium]
MERDLIKKAKSGDVEAFEQLIRKYEQKIYNIALYFCRNPVEAEDISQMAIIKMFKSLKNFKEQSSLSTWIFRIVRNVFLDECKKSFRRHEVEQIENFEFIDKKSAEEIAGRNQLFSWINSAIKKLPEKFRMVVVLCDMEGFDYKETAEILNVPVGTVRSRLNRARRMLKEILRNFSDNFFV